MNVVLDKQEYGSDIELIASTLKITGGANIKVRNGSALHIECDTLRILGDAKFDCSGTPGSPGLPRKDRMVVASTHEEWSNASEYQYQGYYGRDGSKGGHGGKVFIKYRNIEAGGTLQFILQAGEGGSGAEGQLGLLKCAEHPDHIKKSRGNSGDKGQDGLRGSYRILRRLPSENEPEKLVSIPSERTFFVEYWCEIKYPMRGNMRMEARSFGASCDEAYQEARATLREYQEDCLGDPGCEFRSGVRSCSIL